MKKLKTIIALMEAYVLRLVDRLAGASNSANSVESNSEKIKIGTQIWSTKNLDISTFRNGDAILEAKTNEEWEKAGEAGKPAWCYYDNDPENGKKYGKLYNWYAVSDPRGLAPKGWRVPSDEDWTILTDYLGGEEIAGTKMKSSSGWNDNEGKDGNETNKSGFAGSPGGNRDYNGHFLHIGSNGSWCSSSETGPVSACGRDLYFDSGVVGSWGNVKSSGVSVRVLRD